MSECFATYDAEWIDTKHDKFSAKHISIRKRAGQRRHEYNTFAKGAPIFEYPSKVSVCSHLTLPLNTL